MASFGSSRPRGHSTAIVKNQRYRLGELLRDATDHILLLTATPHKGDPDNFSSFLQLLDADVFADMKSIHEAMGRGVRLISSPNE